MGYQILYGGRFAEETIKRAITKKETKHRFLPILCLVTIGIVLFAVYLRHGSLLPILLPGEPEVTFGALATFEESVTGGGDLAEAFVNFCLEILEGAS